MLSYDDKNAELNKCFKRLISLKTAKNLAHLTSNGKAFQSLGVAQVKDLSPSVDLDMKLGKLSERLSFKFLRLYLDGGLREIRNDIKDGAKP